jgi:hypothetical protein
MSDLYVTNNGVEPLVDSYDGTSYEFLPGKEVQIPEIVAKHVFGYGDDNKEPYFVRLGWMKMSNDLPAAKDRMAQFSFSFTSTKTVHLSAPVVERVAAPMPKARVAAKVAASSSNE